MQLCCEVNIMDNLAQGFSKFDATIVKQLIVTCIQPHESNVI